MNHRRAHRHSIGRLSIAIVLAATVLTTAGCADDTSTVRAGAPGSSPGATAPAGSIPPAAAPGAARGTASPPILELHDVCYGMCAYEVPTGLPSVVVYDDGTVVQLTHTDTWSAPSGPATARSARVWTASQLTISPDELDGLLDLARRGGLTDGGVHNNGTNRYTADGGGSIFIARLDGEVTTVEAPQLFGDDTHNDSDRPAERAQLLALQNELHAYGKDARTAARPIDQWALVARSDGAVTGGELPTPRPWTGVDLASMHDTLSDGARCQVFTDGAFDAAVPEMTTAWVAQNGQRWSVEVRPLLPHQHACADVRAGLDDVHASELAELIRGR